MTEKSKTELRIPARASVWYIGTSIITKALGILMTPIFTRLLTGEEYGAYALYMSYLGIGSLICASLFSGSVIYKGLKEHEESDSFITSVIGVNSIFCLLVCLFLFAFSGFNIDFSILLFLQLLSDTIIGIYTVKCRYSYDYQKVAGVTLLTATLSPILSILLIRGAGMGYHGRIYGLLIATLIMAVPLLFKMLWRSPRLFEKEASKYIIAHSIPLLPHAISGAVVAQADKLIISGILGAVALAKYSVAHSVGVGLLFVVSALGSALNPWIMRKLSQAKTETVGELIRLLTFMLCSATLLLIALTPELMRFLAPREYSEAIGAILPIALATIPSFAASVCTMGLVFSEKGGCASAASLISAAVNISANLIFVPLFDYTGAGISLMLANIALFGVSYLYLSKIAHADIIPIKSAASAFTVTAFWGILIALLYNQSWARMLLLIPPTVIGLGALLESRRYIFEKKEL